MLIKMKRNNFMIRIVILLFFFINVHTFSYSEIMILSGCKNLKDGFIKNEYILDLEKSLMKRNYIYDSKTYKKYRITDLNVKKENSVERFIYKDENLILTDKIGYPQFFTQLVFEKKSPIIKIKTVINNEVGISRLSTCKKVDLFSKES
jgi:hypothetical protein